MLKKNTACARTNDPNRPRVSLFAQNPSYIKQRIEQIMVSRQDERRQMMFERFRKRRMGLQKNKELTEDQIYEIIRKEYEEWRVKIQKEEDMESEKVPEFSIEEMIEMDKEFQQEQYLQEYEYFEKMNQEHQDMLPYEQSDEEMEYLTQEDLEEIINS